MSAEDLFIVAMTSHKTTSRVEHINSESSAAEDHDHDASDWVFGSDEFVSGNVSDATRCTQLTCAYFFNSPRRFPSATKHG